MKKTMKYLLCALSLALLSCTYTNDRPTERLDVQGPLEFKGTTFYLSWTDKARGNYYIQEYLPEGEQPEHFNQMLTLHLFCLDMEVQAAVDEKVKELTNRQHTDPTCRYQVTKSPDGKEMMVDCLLGESKDNQMTIAEFNVYRYKQVDFGSGKKGILVYAYSKRAYGDAITPFYKSLKQTRTELLNTMIGATMPAVHPKD